LIVDFVAIVMVSLIYGDSITMTALPFPLSSPLQLLLLRMSQMLLGNYHL
jgi:hypothetical protein